MLPSRAGAEPQNFDSSIRQKGNAFLALVPHPTEKQWKGREYWQKALPDLKRLHSSICTYCSMWIPYSTGSHSVDHFTAKKIDPTLAYEWANLRYVSSRFNSRKGLSTIADPFSMTFNWFIIDFSNFFIIPNADALTIQELTLAFKTIKVLHFNDDENLINERMAYYDEYIKGNISFDYLTRKAPFLAYEIQRQNL